MKTNGDQETFQKVNEKTFTKPYGHTRFRYARTNSHLCSWMLQYSQLRGHARLVALEIASCYNPGKGYAYPSYRVLSEKTGLSRASIARAVQEMKLSGEWLVVNIGVGIHERRTVNRYVPLSPLSQDSLVPMDDPRSAHRGEWQSAKGRFISIADYDYSEELNELSRVIRKLD